MQGVFEFYRDLPVRPARPERLFFGLCLDALTAFGASGLAERFIRENRLKGKQLRAERLHISLQHVGDYPRLRTKFIYAARRAGNAVSMRPFAVSFHLIKSFEGAPLMDGRPPRRPLVLLGEGEGLFELHKMLGAAMERNGLRAAEGFTPHMTLFYGRELVPLQSVEPIRFVARKFSLIHSERGLTRYNVLDQWSLEG